MQPTAIHVQRWQADSLSQEDASGSVLSTHHHSSNRDNESLSLEQAWNVSPAWINDLNDEDQATKSSNVQLDRLNQQLNQYQALQSKYFTAVSSVRDIQVGYWFQMLDHPELDKNHSSSDKEFLILNKRFYNQNNLPKDMKDQLDKLLILSHWETSKDSDQERQANEFMVVRRSIVIVPEYDPLVHRPVAHVQRAKVTTDGEEIHVDEWGVSRFDSCLPARVIIRMTAVQVQMTMIPTLLGWMYSLLGRVKAMAQGSCPVKMKLWS